MTIHENNDDRVNQGYVAKRLESHLKTLPLGKVLVVETPESRRLSHDIDIYLSGMYVGVAEVKCRTETFATFNKWGTIILEVERVENLKKYLWRKDAKCWSKPIMVIWRTSDNVLLTIMMDKIIRHWGEYEDAAPEMMKDNHGKQLANKRGKLIPLDLLKVMP